MRGAGGAVPPGGVLGVLGAGQLGRMFAAAAVRMGYRVHVFAPDAHGSPASVHAEHVVQAEWTDEAALDAFGAGCDAVTLEFENVPTLAVETLARSVPVRPGARSLQVAQRRDAEKRFLAGHGLPHVPWCSITSEDDVQRARERAWGPAILKTAGFGYDGKGQRRLSESDDLLVAWDSLGRTSAVLERRLDLAEEWSVIVARGDDGTIVSYPPIRNVHVDGILDLSVSVPGLEVGGAGSQGAEEMVAIASGVATALDHVGVTCVEFFVDGTGLVWVNEIAPRPHNSGHLTIEAFDLSQFDLQVRATAGLPLSPPQRLGEAAMANLVGRAVGGGGGPGWARALGEPGVCAHMYGKRDVRPGRKMGHVTVVRPATTSGSAATAATRAADLEEHATSVRHRLASAPT